MTSTGLDPVMHEPVRLRIAAALAALPAGDAVSVSRLRDLTGLSPARLDSGLGELGRAGYVHTDDHGGDVTGAVAALTHQGRDALERYATALRQPRRPGPDVRASDADRTTAAAALAEHYARGRLTYDEFSQRLADTLTARTHGELARAARDLPGQDRSSGSQTSSTI
jgi:DNA-binding transcriptional ArsR family regulator